MHDLHSHTPNMLDLHAAMSLAADSITHRLDESQNYRPYFYIKGRDGVPAELRHGSWDLGDMTGRYIESMVMARQMVGECDRWKQAQDRLMNFMISLFDENDLIHDIDQDKPDHMFAQGSALYGLLAVFEDSGHGQDLIERLISGLLKRAEKRRDYLCFPECATSTPCSHMAGYQIFPAMRFYEMTGFAPAMELSEGLSRWAFYHDDTLADDGRLTRIGWEGHIHAWVDTLCGVMRCSRASGALDHGEMLAKCKANYDWIRANYVSDFGWCPDFPTSPTSETCAISSMMRMALELIHEGYGQYWNDFECFTRNQLVENQFRHVDSLQIADARVHGSLKGAFDCWAKPNTLFANVRQWGKEDDGDVEGCCVNGGMRGIYMAGQNVVAADAASVRVNLLMDHNGADAKIEAALPTSERLWITPCREFSTIMVRLPDWASSSGVQVTGADSRVLQENGGAWLCVDGCRAEQRYEVTIPQRRTSSEFRIGDETYRALWIGDTVIAIEPQGGRYPIFQRSR